AGRGPENDTALAGELGADETNTQVAVHERLAELRGEVQQGVDRLVVLRDVIEIVVIENGRLGRRVLGIQVLRINRRPVRQEVRSRLAEAKGAVEHIGRHAVGKGDVAAARI